MAADGQGAKEYEGCVKDLLPSHLPLFSFLPVLAHTKKWPFSARTPNPPPASFLFLSHLLSLRPNYMVDRVIDTGESESPLQAA